MFCNSAAIPLTISFWMARVKAIITHFYIIILIIFLQISVQHQLLVSRNHATCCSFLYVHATVQKKSSFIFCTNCTPCTSLHTIAHLRTHELSTNIAINHLDSMPDQMQCQIIFPFKSHYLAILHKPVLLALAISSSHR